MRRQRGLVKYSSTLNGGVDSSTTSWVVTSASGLPTEGDFYLACSEEVVLVTARSGTTLTVVRGSAGSAAAAHSTGATVQSIIMAEEYTNRMKDYGRIKALPYGVLQNEAGTILTSADFTSINTSTGSALEDGPDGIIRFCSRNHTADDLSGASGPSIVSANNTRVIAHLAGPTCNPDAAGAGDYFGLYARQETGGYMVGLALYPFEKINLHERTTYLNAPSVTTMTHDAPGIRDIWVMLEQSWNYSGSTDRSRFYYSLDGVHWWEAGEYTAAMSTIKVGLWVSNRSPTAHAYYILSWHSEAF